LNLERLDDALGKGDTLCSYNAENENGCLQSTYFGRLEFETPTFAVLASLPKTNTSLMVVTL
jgi:hypothetical protein